MKAFKLIVSTTLIILAPRPLKSQKFVCYSNSKPKFRISSTVTYTFPMNFIALDPRTLKEEPEYPGKSHRLFKSQAYYSRLQQKRKEKRRDEHRKEHEEEFLSRFVEVQDDQVETNRRGDRVERVEKNVIIEPAKSSPTN